MKAFLKSIAAAALLLALAAAAFLFTPLGEAPLSAVFPVGKLETLDFGDLKLTEKPNQFLVCPPGLCRGQAESAPFERSADDLKGLWHDLVMSKARVVLLRESGDQLDYVQRSAHFRFPDIITVRFIPISQSQSTFAIYSRSLYGHSDLGVNRQRIETWLAELQAQ